MTQNFSSEQLNFYKFSAIVMTEFPKALRQVFKAEWDRRFSIPKWDDSKMVRNMLQNNEGGNMTHVLTDKSYMEWDCTALFQATLYAPSFVQSEARKRGTNLYDLYVKPRRLKGGAFHHSVSSQTGNNEETLALALDQLRLLRNALFHQTNTQSIDSSTFNKYLFLAEDAFRALCLSFESVGNLLKEGVLDFHASNIKELLDWLRKEKNAATESTQFENHLSEIKAPCNTKVTDHGGPKLENNCRFTGSEAKSSTVDGNTKVVKQAQKSQGEDIFFSSRLFRKMPIGAENEVSIVKAKVNYTVAKEFRTDNNPVNYTFIIISLNADMRENYYSVMRELFGQPL